MSAPDIVARDLVVRYGRKRQAHMGLRGFSARFGPGITGLVGPNGAGKSTFLRTACGLMRPADGSIAIGGADPRSYVATHGIGYLPETPAFPEHLTAREFLLGLDPDAPRDAPGDVDPFGIPEMSRVLDRRIGTLSLGQRKKVALAAALSRGPALLLLDEPTNGLDPGAVQDLRAVLMELRGAGLTIIVSSHHLDELQRVVDSVVFVDEGRSPGAWTREEALGRYGTLDALFQDVFRRRSA